MKHNFPHLFSPLKVRDMIFPNRIFVAPHSHSAKHMHPSSYESLYDAGLEFFDKSMGGFGAIELVTMMPIVNGKYDKYKRDQIRELQSMAVQTGGRVGAILYPRVKPPVNSELKPQRHEIKVEGGVPFGPPMDPPKGDEKLPIIYRASNGVWDGIDCYEMPKSYMLEIIESIREAAKVAKDFDFDYVSVGGFVHGGPFLSFISEKENHRTDEFGGSPENRCRFPLMLLQAVREAVGPGMPIVVNVVSSLYDERSADVSHTRDELIDFLKRAQDVMDVAIISGGMDATNLWSSNVFHCGTIFQQKAQELEFAKRVKQEVPNMIVVPRGGFNEPEVMEEIIANGWADAICVGRQFVADPYWPKKCLEGREEDITPCIRCDHCYHPATNHELLSCSVNPRLFRERRVPLRLEKAEVLKKVVVIGGGPGGCKAAITAAQRGHDVTLIEKSDELGGQLKHSVYDRHKTDLVRYMNYLKTQIAKSDVKVLYNTEATPDMVRAMEPDALVIAIGADPLIPKIPGVEKAYEATDIYTHEKDIGQRVVIVGGGCVGAELALHLAESKRNVTIIEMGKELAAQGHFMYKSGLRHTMWDVKEYWEEKLECTCTEILDDGVKYKDKDGVEHFVEADTVIMAAGMRAKRSQAFEFYGIAPQTTMIGDCNRVGKVLQATRDGYFFAATL